MKDKSKANMVSGLEVCMRTRYWIGFALLSTINVLIISKQQRQPGRETLGKGD